jgi:hypothetical protein
MCSPFGAHLRDLGCAAQHNRARLATFTFVRAAGWPRIVFAFRRSRHARLHGACDRARLSTFAFTSRSGFDVVCSCEQPSPAPSRVHALFTPCEAKKERAHLLVLVSALVFRRSRPAALHRLTVHGLARSCHVSTAQSSDPLSVRGPPLRAAPVNHADARLATITNALPYGSLRCSTHLSTCRPR